MIGFLRSFRARRVTSPRALEVMPRQAPPAQSSESTRGAAASEERRKASGPSGVTTESSTSDCDVVGVGGGVGERDLGPVGDAVEDELVVAARHAERLDVLATLSAVRKKPRAGPICSRALSRDPGQRAAGAPERGADEASRAARAPLVVDEQVAGRPAPAPRSSANALGERDGGLAGAARERDDGHAGRVGGGGGAGGRERDVPGRSPEWSSGTSSVAHSKPVGVQGLQGRAAAALAGRGKSAPERRPQQAQSGGARRACRAR